LTGTQSAGASEMANTLGLTAFGRRIEAKKLRLRKYTIYLNKSSSNRVPFICCLLQHIACSACQWHLRKIDWGSTAKRVKCVNPWHPHEPTHRKNTISWGKISWSRVFQVTWRFPINLMTSFFKIKLRTSLKKLK